MQRGGGNLPCRTHASAVRSQIDNSSQSRAVSMYVGSRSLIYFSRGVELARSCSPLDDGIGWVMSDDPVAGRMDCGMSVQRSEDRCSP